MITFLFILFAHATDVGNKEVIQSLESVPKERSFGRGPVAITPRSYTKPRAIESGNLAGNLVRSRGVSVSADKSLIVRPKQGVTSHDIAIFPGDIFNCDIRQSIIGYVGSVSPVNAEILDGPYKGYLFVGNATMDAKTKNVLVQFHLIRSKRGDSIARVTATVQSVTGELGLEGTVNSHYWQYFFASVLASAAEGYAEATVQKQRNLFGDYQNVPSSETAAKSGVAQGAAQTADVMADQMKSAPEYTTVEGPIRTRIFVMDNK